MHGTSIPDDTATYRTIGVPAPTNTPPAVYETCEWDGTCNSKPWTYSVYYWLIDFQNCEQKQESIHGFCSFDSRLEIIAIIKQNH
jgi:hypothetical protein